MQLIRSTLFWRFLIGIIMDHGMRNKKKESQESWYFLLSVGIHLLTNSWRQKQKWKTEIRWRQDYLQCMYQSIAISWWKMCSFCEPWIMIIIQITQFWCIYQSISSKLWASRYWTINWNIGNGSLYWVCTLLKEKKRGSSCGFITQCSTLWMLCRWIHHLQTMLKLSGLFYHLLNHQFRTCAKPVFIWT